MSSNETYVVLVFPVGKPPEVTEIATGLPPIYKLIGGDTFQLVPFAPAANAQTSLEVFCYENAKYFPDKYARNRKFGDYDELRGDFFVSKTNPATGENESLTQADIKIAEHFFAGQELS